MPISSTRPQRRRAARWTLSARLRDLLRPGFTAGRHAGPAPAPVAPLSYAPVSARRHVSLLP